MQGPSVDSAVCGYVVDNMDDEECWVICLDSTKEMILLPCGHTVRPTASVLHVSQ